jgi:hypothetical protein
VRHEDRQRARYLVLWQGGRLAVPSSRSRRRVVRYEHRTMPVRRSDAAIPFPPLQARAPLRGLTVRTSASHYSRTMSGAQEVSHDRGECEVCLRRRPRRAGAKRQRPRECRRAMLPRPLWLSGARPAGSEGRGEQWSPACSCMRAQLTSGERCAQPKEAVADPLHCSIAERSLFWNAGFKSYSGDDVPIAFSEGTPLPTSVHCVRLELCGTVETGFSDCPCSRPQRWRRRLVGRHDGFQGVSYD